MNAQPAVHQARNNANLRVYKVIHHYVQSANGGLSNGRVSEVELLKQESGITKHIYGILRAREWCDTVVLGIVAIRISYNLVFWFGDGMHARWFP